MTTIVNGVEYEKFPPPSVLWRATRHSYAQDIIQKGLIYFTNAKEFRTNTNRERGDLTETDGNFIRNGVPCSTTHTNPVFLFCTTFEPDAETLLAIWRDCDTVYAFITLNCWQSEYYKLQLTKESNAYPFTQEALHMTNIKEELISTTGLKVSSRSLKTICRKMNTVLPS